MSSSRSLNYNHLLNKLKKYGQNHFSGRLTIKVQKIPSWYIYFNTGSIVWAAGGVHPVRRWLRQLQKSGCQITVPEGMTKETLLSCGYECWDYYALASLKQQNYLSSQQVLSIIEGTVTEVLFDVIQNLTQILPEQVDQIAMLRKQDLQPCPTNLLLEDRIWDLESTKQSVVLSWRSWNFLDFSNYSPNLGVTVNQEPLNDHREDSVIQFLYQIQQNQPTLRDLAVQNNKNLFYFLQTIKDYYHQNLIRFKLVPDLWQDAYKAQQKVDSSVGEPTGALVKDNDGEVSGEHYDTSSLGTRSSKVSPSEQGSKVNVMETLVAEELARQIKTLHPRTKNDLNQLDIITYALNRLPPLYASSQEGIAYQTQEAKHNHLLAIQREVERAIKTVRRQPNPRSKTRITSSNQVEA